MMVLEAIIRVSCKVLKLEAIETLTATETVTVIVIIAVEVSIAAMNRFLRNIWIIIVSLTNYLKLHWSSESIYFLNFLVYT